MKKSELRQLIKEELQKLKEGVYDPGILKAFFMAGGPGSGKSYVVSEIFGFPKQGLGSVSYETGLKLINSDTLFEKGLKAAGYDPSELETLAKDPEKWAKVMVIRDKAKKTTKRFQSNYLNSRLGQVIDGTGKDFNRMFQAREIYKNLGYDTYMIFVNTSLEVALERNKLRERKLDDKLVEKMWKEVQTNLGSLQKLFGSDKMIIIDNSGSDKETLNQITKQIKRFIKTPIENPLGKKWIKGQIETKKGINEFKIKQLNERFINIHKGSDLEPYIDEVWDILQKSYKSIGGFATASTKEELMDKVGFAKLVRKNGKIVAVKLYKDFKGRKAIAGGSDGTEEGKRWLRKTFEEDAKFNRAWGEFSGVPAHWMKKFGAVPIPNTAAEEILGKPIKSLDDDGFHYTREIGGVDRKKILLGNIKKKD